jgi:hypothetical protein
MLHALCPMPCALSLSPLTLCSMRRKVLSNGQLTADHGHLLVNELGVLGTIPLSPS